LDDAEQVCSGHGVSSAAVLAGIAGLVGKSLIGCQANGTAVRYQLLRTVRSTVASAPWAQHELGAMRPQHVLWCTGLAEGSAQAADSAAGLAFALERIGQHYGDMLEALSWCRSAAAASGLRLATALGLFWQVRGPVSDGCRWFGELMGAVP